MNVMGIRAYIVNKLKKLYLRHPWISNENSQHISIHKNELHPCHSLRIFAVTNMQRSRIGKTIRERNIVLADHIEKKDLMMIYRVNHLDKAFSDLKSRGRIEKKR
jgi:hypothetical protein